MEKILKICANSTNEIQLYKATPFDGNKWLKGYLIEYQESIYIKPLPEYRKYYDNWSKHNYADDKKVFIEVDPTKLRRLVNQNKYGELYTGDIVEFSKLGYIGVIIYDGDSYWVKVKYNNTDEYIPKELTELDDHVWRVIGNIYDNPELLKENETTEEE